MARPGISGVVVARELPGLIDEPGKAPSSTPSGSVLSDR
jgi:hypothetical protein